MIQANESPVVFGVVYKITNLINGKLYFGITRCNIQKRWNEHKHNSVMKKKKSFLNNSIHKYGPDNFKIELFKTCYTEPQLYFSEMYFIKHYNTNNRVYGYNNSIGGEKSSLGKKLSNDAKRKISEYQKGRKRKPHSVQSKLKMSEKAKNRDMANLWVKSVLKRKGKNISDSHKRNLSISLKGKNSVPVIMIDKKTGSVLNEFNSITDAVNKTGILQGCISNNLTNRAKTAGGFIWQYNVQN